MSSMCCQQALANPLDVASSLPNKQLKDLLASSISITITFWMGDVELFSKMGAIVPFKMSDNTSTVHKSLGIPPIHRCNCL